MGQTAGEVGQVFRQEGGTDGHIGRRDRQTGLDRLLGRWGHAEEWDRRTEGEVGQVFRQEGGKDRWVGQTDT